MNKGTIQSSKVDSLALHLQTLSGKSGIEDVTNISGQYSIH